MSLYIYCTVLHLFKCCKIPFSQLKLHFRIKGTRVMQESGSKRMSYINQHRKIDLLNLVENYCTVSPGNIFSWLYSSIIKKGFCLIIHLSRKNLMNCWKSKMLALGRVLNQLLTFPCKEREKILILTSSSSTLKKVKKRLKIQNMSLSSDVVAFTIKSW